MFDFVANPGEAVIGLFVVLQRLPIVQIHMPAAFVDIIGNHPGQRSDVAIPRPMSLI